MKKLFATTAVALALAAPAFASPLVGNDSHDTNIKTIQVSKQQFEAILRAQSEAAAAAGASSKATGGKAAAGANAEGGDSGGNTLEGDDTKTEVYAISYTDAAPPTVPASIGDGVVVTTWGVKVLGPVFGMTDQHVHYLPAAVESAADLGFKATTNDGTQAGEQKQFTYIAAICAHDTALAEQLNFGCK